LPGGAALIEPGIGAAPISLKKKIKLWRKAYNRLPSLAPMQPRAIQMIDFIAAKAVAGERILFTHGLWQESTSPSPLTFRIVESDFNKPHAVYAEQHVEIERIERFAGEVHAITISLIPVYMETARVWSATRATGKP
jgi:hypothetical protein